MIISITRGKDPAGLVAYLLGSTSALREGAKLVGFDNLASFETAPKEMAYTASLSDRVDKYVLHVSASPAPGETLTEAQWARVWHRIGVELGMQEHQSITVEHNDGRPHQHRAYNIIHVETHRTPTASRVCAEITHDGVGLETSEPKPSQTERRTWDSNIKFRLQQLSRELEIELGLTSAVAPELWRSNRRSPLPTPSVNQHEQRTGLAPVEAEYGDAIRRALRKPGWPERERDLHSLGIGMELYAGPNARRKGISLFVIQEPNRRCSGSALGSDYGLGALERSAGETLAAFLEGRPSAARSQAPPKPRGPDPLYEQFLLYKAEQRAAREAYRLLLLVAHEEHKLRIAAEKRRHRAMRSALIATASRVQRYETIRWARITEQLALTRMRQAHQLELDASRSIRPRTLDWSNWLAREAEAGNATARAYLQRATPQRSNRSVTSIDKHSGIRPDTAARVGAGASPTNLNISAGLGPTGPRRDR